MNKKSISIAAISLMLLAGCGATTTEDEASSGGGNKASSKNVKPVSVKAADLLKQFEENELKADAKYKGKVLRVTGVVDKIDAEFLDDSKYVLRMDGGSEYNVTTVNVSDIPSGQLSKLNQGDSVTVVGTFDDGGDLGVEIKDGKLS